MLPDHLHERQGAEVKYNEACLACMTTVHLKQLLEDLVFTSRQ